MAQKQMTYTGTGLTVSVNGEVVDLSKGDVVDYDEYGGDGFFEGRTDFKVKATTRKAKTNGN